MYKFNYLIILTILFSGETFSMPLNQSTLATEFKLLGFKMNETLSDGAIQLVANKSAELITQNVYKTIKDTFATFAPDSWVSALNKIKITTFRCVVREGVLIGLEIYNKMDTSNFTPTNFTNDQVKTIIASMNYTQDQILSKISTVCSDGWEDVERLCHAVNETMNKLPPHVLQIFAKDLQTITPDELVQMGELFPKLKWLFSLQFYKLMDLLAQSMQGDNKATVQFGQLGAKMYQEKNRCY
ncbi:hypothetical protein Mgra_00008899 [Meloidogyne graminicola]|uniref:Uncharacterized protein n=1 Tax=Meloidogyne graminicola TaxID=189291 RepID=A0A8S9ZEJ2_9BILA|nr:hypothetical protein Mgra_00008899 [Meloidogyne graminicola]